MPITHWNTFVSPIQVLTGGAACPFGAGFGASAAFGCGGGGGDAFGGGGGGACSAGFCA